jgi:NPCBM/NEW2 domain/RTX calcium-binding nonapeptide repeat (4 copies)
MNIRRKVAAVLVAAAAVGAVSVADGVVEAAPLTCAGERVTIKGTAGKDTIRGTRGRDVIHGQGGGDVIKGLGGGDIICGGGGNDRIYGGGGRDRIYGGGRHDAMYGGAGTDRLYGQRGNDLLDGGKGSNPAKAGKGIDTCLRSTIDRQSSCEPHRLGYDPMRSVSNTNHSRGGTWFGEEVSTVNGKQYRNNFVNSSGYCWITNGDYAQIEYDLGRKYKRFVTTIGLRDDSYSGGMARYSFYGDGPDPLYERTVAFGQSFPVKVDVTGVLRLKLRVTTVADKEVCDSAQRHWAVITTPYVSANPFITPQR